MRRSSFTDEKGLPKPRNAKGGRIRALREQAGISQAEFARKLQRRGWDCDVVVLNRIEQRKRLLTDTEIEIILKALKKTWADLSEN